MLIITLIIRIDADDDEFALFWMSIVSTEYNLLSRSLVSEKAHTDDVRSRYLTRSKF